MKQWVNECPPQWSHACRILWCWDQFPHKRQYVGSHLSTLSHRPAIIWGKLFHDSWWKSIALLDIMTEIHHRLTKYLTFKKRMKFYSICDAKCWLDQQEITERQKNRAHNLAFQSLRNCGWAFIKAEKKSPCLFSSWHQFSKYLKIGYTWNRGFAFRCLYMVIYLQYPIFSDKYVA